MEKDRFDICANCGKSFELTRAQRYRRNKGGKNFYCSKECSSTVRRAAPIESICPYCGKVFILSKAQRKTQSSERLFCSMDCANKGKKRRGTKDMYTPKPKVKVVNYEPKIETDTCHQCGTTFELSKTQRLNKTKGQTIFFCSKKCLGEYNRVIDKGICAYCGSEFLTNAYTRQLRREGEPIFCSVACSTQKENARIVADKTLFEEYVKSIPRKDRTRVFIAKLLDYDQSTIADKVIKYGLQDLFPPTSFSIGEKELAEFVRSLGFEVIENDRKHLGRYEIDIYIPSINVGIEYNGTYWHSQARVIKNDLKKREIAEKIGLKLLTVTEEYYQSDKEHCKKSLRETLLILSGQIVIRLKAKLMVQVIS